MNRTSTSARQQARNDDRENSRVFVYGACVALLVFIGALLYFYATDQRGEGPPTEAAPPAMQQQAPQGAAPAPAAPAAPAAPSR